MSLRLVPSLVAAGVTATVLIAAQHPGHDAAPGTADSQGTDPKTGGPWVMWKGTPYAHLMVPVSVKQAPVMK